MITFSKEFDKWAFERNPGPGTLHLTGVETKGNDLEDMLANAQIYVESDHGGPVEMDIGDLPQNMFDHIDELFQERLRDEADARAEALSDVFKGEG